MTRRNACDADPRVFDAEASSCDPLEGGTFEQKQEDMIRFKYLVLALGAAPAILAAAGCAKGKQLAATGGAGGGATGGSGPSSGTGTGTGSPTGSTTSVGGTQNGTTTSGCGNMCDSDGDGVIDSMDMCPGTPMGQPVNKVGCAASQLTPKLEAMFPPYGLTWTPTGDPGRAGGLTWTYTGIARGDLFHIYWVLCDDPATPCGVSLDGPVKMTDQWTFSAADSNLPSGKAVFLNMTHIALADGTTPAVTGRMTVTVVDGNNAPLPVADLATLEITGRVGQYGAEIPGTGFTATVLIEVQDAMSMWHPYLDYFDAAMTLNMGPGTAVSIAGSFYDE